MNYPFEEAFSDGTWRGVVRLKVAAICACIDNADSGTGYGAITGSALEEEIAEFARHIERLTPSGVKQVGPIDPHAFLYIEPTGNLQIDVEDVLDALCISIDKGQLAPVSLRISLDNVIDVNETWITTRDFAKWCDARGMGQGEMCDKYQEGEYSIYEHAEANAHDLRKGLEAPLFDAEYMKIKQPDFDSYDGLSSRYENLFIAHMLQQQSYDPTQPATNLQDGERPLQTRERRTLLSIIAALCNRLNIDPGHHSSASELVRMTDAIGVTLSDDTVRGFLKKIPETLERRRK